MTTTPPLTCDDVAALLFEGVRPGASDAPGIREHMQRCDGCRALQDEIQATVLGTRRLAEDEASAWPAQRVLARLGPTIRDVAQRRQPGRRAWLSWWQLATAGAVAIALAALPITRWLRPTEVAGQVVACEGAVTVRHRGTTLAATTQTMIHSGDSVEVGARARLAAGLARALVTASSATRLAVLRLDARGMQIRLETGALVTDVDPHDPRGGELTYSLPRADVHVLGTVLRVRSSATQDEVAVVRGKVRVEPRGMTAVVLTAGERLILSDAGLRRDSLSSSDVDDIRAALDVTRWSAAATHVVTADTAQINGPVTPTKPPRRSTSSGTKSATSSSTFSLDRVNDLVRAGDCAAAESLASGADARTPAADRAEGWVLVADCYVRVGGVDRAMAIYATVADKYARTHAAQNATYQRGRVALQAGDRKTARGAFTAYVSRYAKGPLATEARYRLCTLDVEEERHASALACVRKYRRDYPTGARAHETYFVEATILRSVLNDCREAIVAYDRYLEQPGDLGEQAQRWREFCREKLGR